MTTPEQKLKKELDESHKAILKLEAAIRKVELRARRAEQAARQNAIDIAQLQRVLNGRGA